MKPREGFIGTRVNGNCIFQRGCPSQIRLAFTKQVAYSPLRMADRKKTYPFDEFEPAWQKRWDDQKTFRVGNPGDPDFDAAKPKRYILDMFPYRRLGQHNKLTKADLIKKCMETLAIPDPTSMVMIGNTKDDKQAAKAEGVQFLGVRLQQCTTLCQFARKNPGIAQKYEV